MEIRLCRTLSVVASSSARSYTHDSETPTTKQPPRSWLRPRRARDLRSAERRLGGGPIGVGAALNAAGAAWTTPINYRLHHPSRSTTLRPRALPSEVLGQRHSALRRSGRPDDIDFMTKPPWPRGCSLALLTRASWHGGWPLTRSMTPTLSCAPRGIRAGRPLSWGLVPITVRGRSRQRHAAHASRH
jgi:hypothetical protein